MSYQHQQQAVGEWNKLSLVEQMANIGSEVIRAIGWKKKANQPYSQAAFYRALELLSLSKADPKNRTRLKEICRCYECLVDYFAGDNTYSSTDSQWQKYFLAFNWAARKKY